VPATNGSDCAVVADLFRLSTTAGTRTGTPPRTPHPVGALLQYGVAWIIEHVKPLSEALDWLAGDPAQIAAHAQTWRNVAASVRGTVTGLADAVDRDVHEWHGAAADADRKWAGDQRSALDGLASVAQTLATIVEAAGFLISAVSRPCASWSATRSPPSSPG
jgi:hypothetical protein